MDMIPTIPRETKKEIRTITQVSRQESDWGDEWVRISRKIHNNAIKQIVMKNVNANVNTTQEHKTRHDESNFFGMK